MSSKVLAMMGMIVLILGATSLLLTILLISDDEIDYTFKDFAIVETEDAARYPLTAKSGKTEVTVEGQLKGSDAFGFNIGLLVISSIMVIAGGFLTVCAYRKKYHKQSM
ncbi:MAG: hypothetical protein H6850_02110 [Alphaproteobacteria bacterium]|nr:MAG: hypothetical protein H6850_02110 [Alphaproteobacteria bacterium]